MAWRGPGSGSVDITALLGVWGDGHDQAFSELLPLIYDDVRQLARRHLRAARSNRAAVESGTLAHELYLRLLRAQGIRFRDRAHFYAVCSQMMRRLLIDHARRERFAKRGGALLRVPFDEALLGGKSRGVDIEALDDALTRLGKLDPRKTRVVELRFFAGLSVREVAEILEISEETVTRDWRMARTWLFRELQSKRTGA